MSINVTFGLSVAEEKKWEAQSFFSRTNFNRQNCRRFISGYVIFLFWTELDFIFRPLFVEQAADDWQILFRQMDGCPVEPFFEKACKVFKWKKFYLLNTNESSMDWALD